MEEDETEDEYIRKQMDDFIASLEITYGITINPFKESTKAERRAGFKIIMGEIPFESYEDTHYILLLPAIIFQPGPENRGFFVSGSEEVIKRIVKKMEFNAQVPERERLEDTSGLISREDFDKMWGKK